MGKRSKRRQEFKLKKTLEQQGKQPGKPTKTAEKPARNRSGFLAFYEDHYKKLLIIPFIILFAALLQIGMQQATTGDFLNKDVSLKGGLTVTLPTQEVQDLDALQSVLEQTFPEASFDLRLLSSFGTQIGISVSADLAEEDTDQFISILVQETGVPRDDLSVEQIGSSLGASFFKQTLIAILIAFVFMGIVVFLYFRTFVPSMAVILSAFSDMTITLAIVNLLGMKLSTAGIAAFLMLIGYSVDTDILLTIRVLKRKEGSVMERIYGAIKTGITMNVTTLAAVTVAMLLSESDVLRQIMTILFIGLFVDMLNTWIQNVGIIRWYVERKEAKGGRV